MQRLFVASAAVLIAIVTFTKGPYFWVQSLTFYMAAAVAFAIIIMYVKDRPIEIFSDPALWLMVYIPALVCVMALAHFHVTIVGSMALGIIVLLCGWAVIGLLRHFKVIH